MPGGELVVLDRGGREGKRYRLAEGLATLGSDPACDIRVLLPAVQPHHATVVVRTAQTVVRSVAGGPTLVNGRPVTVAALRHGDVLTLADRSLRWLYDGPPPRRRAAYTPPAPAAPPAAPAPPAPAGRPRAPRRGSGPAPPPPRDRSLQLALEMKHRVSMPGSSGGKQVAIVQPQRRGDTTNEQIEKISLRAPSQPKRRSKTDLDNSIENEAEISERKTSMRGAGHAATKASLWIESRRPPPRRRAGRLTGSPRAPRLTGSPRAARLTGSPRAPRPAAPRRARSELSLVKIQDPLEIDHTKRAAIMLMTGHSKLSPGGKKSSRSPSFVVKKPSPVRKTPRGNRSKISRDGAPIGSTPSRGSTSHESVVKKSGNHSVSILEITDSTLSPGILPSLPSPKKSALKDLSRKSTRKTESIKFDLSNLENHHKSNDAMSFNNTTYCESETSLTEDCITLHYTDSGTMSPSPRKAIHSRSSKIFEKLGATLTSSVTSPARTMTPESPRPRKSTRSTILVEKALESSNLSDYTKSLSSVNTTSLADNIRTRTLSPRSKQNLESYSVVDLVSLDSNTTSDTVYGSAGSGDATCFGTPETSVVRRTRSNIDPVLLGSSTPYAQTVRATRSKSDLSTSLIKSTRNSSSSRRSKSLSTPENARVISFGSTRRARASRNRSRIIDGTSLPPNDTEAEDSSPKTSKRGRATESDNELREKVSSDSLVVTEGTSTPENRPSVEEVGTPVLSIQTLLDSSQSSFASPDAGRGGRHAEKRRKTIGVPAERKRRAQVGLKGKSLDRPSRTRSLRQGGTEGAATPRSAARPPPEGVKNKHSTARKPKSKRSLIDDLHRSDIVKQLFNSPVKRKLSQSMTEFSRKHLSDDEGAPAEPKRRTTAGGGLDHRAATATPERAASPRPAAPRNEGRTPRPSSSVVSGLKNVFRKSPRNRLSDVRGVKGVFGRTPTDDLRRVSGVRALFRGDGSPRNDLTDVRGVKKMFQQNSPRNDLQNVSGVRRTMRNSKPKDDLTDVRGVRRLFQHESRRRDSPDVSGIEELFNDSDVASSSEYLFDRLLGKPPIRSVYSKTSLPNVKRKPKPRRNKSLQASIDVTAANVERWLERELRERLRNSRSYRNATDRELQKLATETVAGGDSVRVSRTRNSSAKKSASEIYGAHTLPIKKRSLAEGGGAPAGGGGGGPVGGGGGGRGERQLPIKKRAVPHSTPLKGRADLTLNSTALGRVSPIQHDLPDLGRLSSSTRSTRVITEETPQEIIIPHTPTKPATPGSIAAPSILAERPSPPRRATRNRTKVDLSVTNARRSRASLVITKKQPVLSPRARRGPGAAEDSGRKVPSPRKTRARAAGVAAAVVKQSPKPKPGAGGDGADRLQTKVPKVKVKSNRDIVVTVEKKTESAKESPKRSMRNRANKTITLPEPNTRNKKATDKSTVPGRKRKSPRVTSDTEAESDSAPQPPKRNRRARAIPTKNGNKKTPNELPVKAESAQKGKQKRAPETDAIEVKHKSPKRLRKTRANATSTELEPETGATAGALRRQKKLPPPPEEHAARPQTRAKKVETQAKPTARTRTTKVEEQPALVIQGRKRKYVDNEELTSNNTKGEETADKTKRATKTKKVNNSTQEPPKTTRRTKTKPMEKEANAATRARSNKIEVPKSAETKLKSVRGRKGAAELESAATTSRGKRKAAVDPSPHKAAAKKPATASANPTRRNTRAMAVSQGVTAGAGGGRSRRR